MKPDCGKKAMAFLSAAACLMLFAANASGYDISSKAAVVMEAQTGRILFAKNPNLRLPPASTTKLMTAMVVLDRVGMDKVVTISRRAAGAAPTKINLLPGETVKVGTLLYAALLMSANDAATALAEGAAGSEAEFVKLMNSKAALMGLKDTRFINATGLPGKGQRTTALDLAKIMRQALLYPAIKGIINTKSVEVSTERDRSISLENTNKLLWQDEGLIGGKTGYTNKARHCFVCAAQREDETLIAAMLGTPNRKALWREFESLMEEGFDTLAGKKEPVVYITKTGNAETVRKVVYKKGPRLKVSSGKTSQNSGKKKRNSNAKRHRT
ncbi:MAG: D-alanyl-D-alanine carboxypeptidase family protein [Thermodesulfovibrionales bacterium]|nr:D-alanyl-D-alanine carboxypeptidase family protein [Thermodesulfovibrionales bacterium]